MSLYDDLGVLPDATPEEIIAAYRRQAKSHHPDAGGDPEEFAKIQHAADVLRDAQKRARYDETGESDDTAAWEQAEAAKALSSVFAQILQQAQANLPAVNLALDLRSAIEKLIASARNDRRQLREAQEANAEAQRRLRHRGTGKDVLRAMLEHEHDDRETAIRQSERRGRVLETALAMAREYDWIVDLEELETVRLPGSPGEAARMNLRSE